jgi:hypothetical protein
MKFFKEDDEENEYYNKQNGLNLTYMEKLEQLESDNYKNKSKDYRSDAPNMSLKHYLHNDNKIIINLVPVPTTSEYSDTEISYKTNKNRHCKKIEDIMKEKEKKLKELINIEGKYDLNITNCVEIKCIFSYIKYEISIFNKENNKTIKVYRRYSEFEKLREILVNKYACIYTPPLPGKVFLGNSNNHIIKIRKKFLQIFLHELQYLVYYFYDSPEINDFLNPNIIYFIPNSYLDIRNLGDLSIDVCINHMEDYCKIARKTFINHIQNIKDKIVLKLREDDMNNKIQLPDLIIKQYPRIIIQKNISRISLFSDNLKNQTNFIDNVYTVLKDIKEKEKEFIKIENNFFRKLISFKNEYTNCLLFQNENTKIIEKKNKKKEDLKNKYLNEPIQRPIYVLIKNITDWSYREDTIIQAYLDSFTSLDYFLNKENEVKREIKLIKTSKYKNKKRDELNKLFKLNKLLNETIILNTIYLHDVRIDRYKYSRFQLYYNAIKFAIKIRKETVKLDNKIAKEIIIP